MERMQGQSLCNSCWIDLGWPIPGTCGFVSQMHMGKYKTGSEVKRIYTTQAQECLEAQQLESGREMWEKKTQSHLLTILDSWFVSPKYGKFSWYMCITITLLGLARLVVFPKVTTATISKCSTKYLWLVKWRKEWADCFSMLGPHLSLQFSSVQFSSVAQSCPTVWDPTDCSTPGPPSITNSQNLLKLKSIELVMPSNHLILCHPLLLPPSIFPSIRVFSNESPLHIGWPKCWSFSFNISPSNEYSGLIPLWWTSWISLQSKGLLRVFSNTTVQKYQFFSKVSVRQCSAFFMGQLSHDYWKNHSLD